MKQFQLLLTAAFMLGLLVACGGGGSSAPVPAPNPVPTPHPTGSPTIGPTMPPANTSLSFYLPLAEGNYWNFNNGARITDTGSFSLSCSCPYNNGKIEEVDLYGPTGTFAGSFFFTKQNGTSGTLWSDVIGLKAPGDASISLVYDSTYTQGIPVMDDAPTVNEAWSVTVASSTVTSTILSTGGTITLANGAPVIDVAVDKLNDPVAGEIVTWSFAKGVGFAGLSIGGQAITTAAFSVDTVHSYSLRTGAKGAQFGVARPASIARLLRALF